MDCSCWLNKYLMFFISLYFDLSFGIFLCLHYPTARKKILLIVFFIPMKVTYSSFMNLIFSLCFLWRWFKELFLFHESQSLPIVSVTLCVHFGSSVSCRLLQMTTEPWLFTYMKERLDCFIYLTGVFLLQLFCKFIFTSSLLAFMERLTANSKCVAHR